MYQSAQKKKTKHQTRGRFRDSAYSGCGLAEAQLLEVHVAPTAFGVNVETKGRGGAQVFEAREGDALCLQACGSASRSRVGEQVRREAVQARAHEPAAGSGSTATAPVDVDLPDAHARSRRQDHVEVPALGEGGGGVRTRDCAAWSCLEHLYISAPAVSTDAVLPESGALDDCRTGEDVRVEGGVGEPVGAVGVVVEGKGDEHPRCCAASATRGKDERQCGDGSDAPRAPA